MRPARPGLRLPARTRRDPGGLAARYRNEVERSRAIVAAADFDDLALDPRSVPEATLREILLHMIQEASRHLGHADIIRESIDGATGD